MNRLITSSFAALAVVLAASPIVAEQPVKTELVGIDGERTDSLRVRDYIIGSWVIDNQNILYSDTARGHYLVTLKDECPGIMAPRRFTFEPADPWRLKTEGTYKVRPWAGRPCDVARIEQIDRAKAGALRQTSVRRDW